MTEILKKICSKHGVLSFENIYQEKANWGIATKCRLCKREKDKRSYKKHAEKRIEYTGKWKKENREYVNEWAKTDRKRNPEKYKKWSKKSRENKGDQRNIDEISRRRGITSDKYVEMHKYQNGLCDICKKPEIRQSRTPGKISRLCIDHNHSTNAVRGLLCHACNQVIGHSRESIDILKAAIEYLQKHS